MIEATDVVDMIRAAWPDAQVAVTDKTGMRDHYRVHVSSRQFADVGLMDRHRMVMALLEPAFRDGRLHAAEIKTEVPE